MEGTGQPRLDPRLTGPSQKALPAPSYFGGRWMRIRSTIRHPRSLRDRQSLRDIAKSPSVERAQGPPPHLAGLLGVFRWG